MSGQTQLSSFETIRKDKTAARSSRRDSENGGGHEFVVSNIAVENFGSSFPLAGRGAFGTTTEDSRRPARCWPMSVVPSHCRGIGRRHHADSGLRGVADEGVIFKLVSLPSVRVDVSISFLSL